MSTDYTKPQVQVQSPDKTKSVVTAEVKVVEKPVVKKSIFKRIANAIVDPSGFGEIKTNVKEQAKAQTTDAVKNIASSVLKGAVDALFHTESRSPFTSYRDYGSRYGIPRSNYSSSIPTYNKRQTFSFDSTRYLISNRQDADAVAQAIAGNVNQFGSCSVMDFYSYVGVEGAYTDDSYGWGQRDIPLMRIKSTPDGFVIDLPEPHQLG